MLSFGSREYNLSATLLFNASTRASEVRLLGTGSTVLRTFDGRRLLRMLPGSPPVLLHRLTLRDQLAIEAGQLRLDECALEGSFSSSDGGALTQSGGSVEARSTSFVRNKAVGNGGAISIDGGSLLLENCLLEGNTANKSGGAMHVQSGVVALRHRTMLKGNFAASSGQSMLVLGGSVDYTLPCPLGHYINAAPGKTSTPLDGAVDKNFPLACAPGLYGNAYDLAVQSGPGCSGECPGGHFCPLGTVEPRPCGSGKYCQGYDLTGRLGATAALPCEEGTYSNTTLLSSAADCQGCPEGHACTTGSIAPVRCSPGTYAPAPGRLPTCKVCPAGEFQDASGATACVLCGGGSYCPVASSAELPCPAGTYSSNTGLTKPSECTDCPEGSSCSTASQDHTPCAPGTVAPNAKSPRCTDCAAGKYQDQPGKRECKACTNGYYCMQGAAAALPCPGGTHVPLNESIVMSGTAQCIICPKGTSCSVGSAEPAACLPGSYSATEKAQSCNLCPEGKFTSTAGNTACETCTEGYLCVKGSSAPQPCSGGTHANQTVLNVTGYLSSLDQCIVCPKGTSCSVGSAEPAACLPGSYSATEKAQSCNLCLAGEYQDESGSTACKVCTSGFYCEVGTAKPTPCPGGTFSSTLGATSRAACEPVAVGFWAPLGSSAPELCPTTGFYCPGAAADELYGGSKPVLVPVGGSTTTEEVETVQKDVTLDVSCNDFDIDQVKATLAAQYNVDVALITLGQSVRAPPAAFGQASASGSHPYHHDRHCWHRIRRHPSDRPSHRRADQRHRGRRRYRPERVTRCGTWHDGIGELEPAHEGHGAANRALHLPARLLVHGWADCRV